MNVIIKRINTSVKEYIHNQYILFVSITLSLLFTYHMNPFDNVTVSSWDRTFCQALASGIDINKRITNLYRGLFIFLLGTIITFFVVCAIYRYRNAYFEGVKKLCIVAIIPVISAWLSKYADESGFIVNENIIVQYLVIYFVFLGIICLFDQRQIMTSDSLITLFLIYIIITTSLKIMTNGHSLCQRVFDHAGLLTGCLFVVFGCLCLVIEKLRQKISKIIEALSVYMWLPFVICLSLEIMYILNSRNRYIKNQVAIVLIFILGLTVIGILIFNNKLKCHMSVNYVGAIAGLGMCIDINPYFITYDYGGSGRLFELGNTSSCMDTILYGKIPVLDYFSAHALGDIWQKVVYVFTHGDYRGVIAGTTILQTALLLVIIYIILKEIFPSNLTVVMLFIFPFNLKGIRWSSLCLISVIALLLLIKYRKLFLYVVFWIILALGAFISYDDGFSVGIACIATSVVLSFGKNRILNFRKLFCSGIAVASLICLGAVTYCLASGIAILDRVREWISVSLQSSSTWATKLIGDATTLGFTFAYFIVPVVAVILGAYSVFKNINCNEKDTDVKKHLILINIFTITEILFISRMIAFHNIWNCKGITGVLFNYLPVTVLVFGSYLAKLKNKNAYSRMLIALLMFAGIIYVEGILVTQQLPKNDTALLAQADGNLNDIRILTNAEEIKGQERIVYTEETEEFVENFERVFDVLLEDDETFIDFSNITGLYALVQRQRPSYVSQTPSLLTDEYSQKCFIEQIKNSSAPLVVIGVDDPVTFKRNGLAYSFRYYILSEYLYDNYRPLVKVNGFAIWCDKARYESYLNMLTNNMIIGEDCLPIDYGYDKALVSEDADNELVISENHSYDIGEIPYIWANNDTKEAVNNEIVCELLWENNKYCFEGSHVTEYLNGKYLNIKCNSSDNKTIKIILSDGDQEQIRYEYIFLVKPGENNYIIRVSSDYFWKAFNIDQVEFITDDTVQIDYVRLLADDKEL